jgi:hypothetical protein
VREGDAEPLGAAGLVAAAGESLGPLDGLALGVPAVEGLGVAEPVVEALGAGAAGTVAGAVLVGAVGLGLLLAEGEALGLGVGVPLGAAPEVGADPAGEPPEEPEPPTLREIVVVPRPPPSDEPDTSSNPVMPAAASRNATSAPAITRRGPGTACRTLDTVSRVRCSEAV